MQRSTRPWKTKPALALHIGVNEVDRASYAPAFYPPLNGPENDARAMREISVTRGFDDSVLLIGREATFDAVENAMNCMIEELRYGGTFLFTFSGHGVRIPATDSYEEGVALHDLIMKDYYIDILLRSLPREARVILVADCCHSGTIKGVNYPRPKRIPQAEPADAMTAKRGENRRMECRLTKGDGSVRKERYRELDRRFHERGLSLEQGVIVADMVMLSACDDNELAADGQGHGLFTACLLETLRHGGEHGSPFTGTYKQFIDAIVRRVQRTTNAQIPRYTPLGLNAGNLGHPFFQGPPFTHQ